MNRSLSWIPSTGSREGFSDGQSLRNSIGPWSLAPYNSLATINCGSHTYIYGSGESETTYEVALTLEMEGETALQRFLGCILIAVIPDEGLEEALLSLREMWEFYTREPSARPMRLAPKAIDATIGDKKKRPNLVIA